jgi:hypothetical protein
VEWNDFNGLNVEEIMNKWWLHVVHLNGPTKKKNVKHQQDTIWHLWIKEWTLTMEIHLFMLVIAISNSTRPFVVSKKMNWPWCASQVRWDESHQCMVAKPKGDDCHLKHEIFF